MWTATTASHSSSVMFTSTRSRRLPALFTRMSRSPNASIAEFTSRWPPSQSATLSAIAIAAPPMPSISATTCCAGVRSLPDPSAAPPTSLTTTLAPSAAKRSACSRPMPRPAPVMMATRPSSAPIGRDPLLVVVTAGRYASAEDDVDLGAAKDVGAPPRVGVQHLLARLARHVAGGEAGVANRVDGVVEAEAAHVGYLDHIGALRHRDGHHGVAVDQRARGRGRGDDLALLDRVVELLGDRPQREAHRRVGELGGGVGDGEPVQIGYRPLRGSGRNGQVD